MDKNSLKAIKVREGSKYRREQLKVQKEQVKLNRFKLKQDISRQKSRQKFLKSKVSSAQFSNNLLNAISLSQSYRGSNKGPGRPKQVYKNPANVPAQQWYKIQRMQKRMARIQAEQVQSQQQRVMAQRGISPEQFNQIQQQRAMQQNQRPFIQRPLQNVPNQPPMQQIPLNQLPDGTVIPMGNKVWRFQRGVVDTDWTMFGTKKVLRGSENAMWN